MALGLARLPANGDLKLTVEVPDISRADNGAMATAAAAIVNAFTVMKAQGWITDEIAIRLAFKFAGEILDEETITEILEAGEVARRIAGPVDPKREAIRAKNIGRAHEADSFEAMRTES